MTVLVAGGAGYIGSHTVTELMSRGFDVVIADDFRGSSRKTLQGIEAITGKRCLCWEGDLRITTVFPRPFHNGGRRL